MAEGSGLTAVAVDPDAQYVQFWEAGASAKGEFHCGDCGYGITIHSVLPVCPMCASTAWEQNAWSPFTRAALTVEV